MKKLLFLIPLLLSIFARADDTYQLQTALNAGPVTLPYGHSAYTVSGSLTVPHRFNLNGNTINFTAASGAVLKVTAANVKVSNGILAGTWNYTTAYNPSGTSGIGIYGNGDTVTNMQITNMSNYGIACSGPLNGLVITNNTIQKVGYMGFFYDAETAPSSGGVFSNNLVDRSMLSPSLVIQEGVDIHGSNTNGNISSNWTISGNTIRMPLNPSGNPNSITAECMELKYLTLCTASNNSFTGGSLGLSIVRCSYIAAAHNKYANQQQEGLEFAGCNNFAESYGKFTGSATDGILLDGYSASPVEAPDTYGTLTGDTIDNTFSIPVNSYLNNSNLTFNGCVISTTGWGINLQQTTNVTLNSCSIDGGSHSGSKGVMLTSSAGNLQINGGAITHCSYEVYAVNSGVNAVVDNIGLYGVTMTGTGAYTGSSFSNGAHFGTHIIFAVASSLNFPGYTAVFSH